MHASLGQDTGPRAGPRVRFPFRRTLESGDDIMIGGLMKRTSLFAIAAVAATAFGASAQAADLGGDCCADLEERVAELEATTARKGNR